MPHASYTASQKLLKKITKIAEFNSQTISIHNQESAEENKFFFNKTGEIVNLYEKIGEDISFFKPTKKTSLQTILSSLPTTSNLLLIHNIYSSEADIKLAERHSKNIYWCMCPNSNIYIS